MLQSAIGPRTLNYQSIQLSSYVLFFLLLAFLTFFYDSLASLGYDSHKCRNSWSKDWSCHSHDMEHIAIISERKNKMHARMHAYGTTWIKFTLMQIESVSRTSIFNVTCFNVFMIGGVFMWNCRLRLFVPRPDGCIYWSYMLYSDVSTKCTLRVRIYDQSPFLKIENKISR